MANHHPSSPKVFTSRVRRPRRVHHPVEPSRPAQDAPAHEDRGVIEPRRPDASGS